MKKKREHLKRKRCADGEIKNIRNAEKKNELLNILGRNNKIKSS